MSQFSTEFVKIQVSAADLGVDTTPVVFGTEMAVIPRSQQTPEEADWRPAEWETIGAGTYARILVGADQANPLPIVPGEWYVWVRIEASPESVVKRAPGAIVVY